MNGNQEACKTYIEQTKLLVTLSSAFLVAPVGLVAFFTKDTLPALTDSTLCWLLVGEALFALSVFFGYVVLGTVTGSQADETFNVYRLATRIFSFAQIGAYCLGMGAFVILALVVFRSLSAAATDKVDIPSDALYLARVKPNARATSFSFWLPLAGGPPSWSKGIDLSDGERKRLRALVDTLKACSGGRPEETVSVQVQGFADANEFPANKSELNVDAANRRARAATALLIRLAEPRGSEPTIDVQSEVRWAATEDMLRHNSYFSAKPLKETGLGRDQGQLNRRIDVVVLKLGQCELLQRR